jgi:hypothetical protein
LLFSVFDPALFTMSLKKLCSQAVNPSILLRKFFTNSIQKSVEQKLFDEQLARQVIHKVNYSQVLGSFPQDQIRPQFLDRNLTRQVNQQTVNYSQALGSLTKDQAHDLVFRLNDEERKILVQTLDQFNVSVEKDGLTCK